MLNDTEKELVDVALAIDAAADNGDTKEVERLEAVFDEAFVRHAKNELAQGRERPTMEDMRRMLSAYDARRREATRL